MTTTYRAAFGNPQAHRPVVDTLFDARPDTSSDAALAQALAEEENAAARQPHAPASPSGVKVHLANWEGAATGGQQKPAGATPFQQHQKHPAQAGQQTGAQVSDAELARQLQRVELASAADAMGTPPSMLYPELLSQQSSREITLNRSLSRAHSVRAAPRVAASAFLPEPEVSADRQRLLLTLQQYDLVERQVAGDGNCQFRSLSDQLYGTPEYHVAVRESVVSTLRQRASSYSCYVPQDYGDYCTSMAKSGTWGDHVTLQAAADFYGLRIMVVTSFKESPVIYIDPAQKRSPRTLYLSFWAEVHYNSLYPAQEPPPTRMAPPADPSAKPPKVLGSRTLGRVVQDINKATEKATGNLNGLLGRTST